MKQEKIEVTLYHYQNRLASIIHPLTQIASLTAVIGLGVWLESPAMQWLAGLLWVIFVVGSSIGEKKNRTYSIPQLKKRVEEIERGEV